MAVIGVMLFAAAAAIPALARAGRIIGLVQRTVREDPLYPQRVDLGVPAPRDPPREETSPPQPTPARDEGEPP